MFSPMLKVLQALFTRHHKKPIFWAFLQACYSIPYIVVSFLKRPYIKIQSQRVKPIEAILNLPHLSRGSFRGFVNFNQKWQMIVHNAADYQGYLLNYKRLAKLQSEASVQISKSDRLQFMLTKIIAFSSFLLQIVFFV